MSQAARPFALLLLAAFASFVLSVTLWFTGSKDEGLFVGLWVPSILSLGTFVVAARPTPTGSGR